MLIEVKEITSFQIQDKEGHLHFEIGIHKDDWNAERKLILKDEIAWDISQRIQEAFAKYFSDSTKTP